MEQILATKLFIPSIRLKIVSRPRLIGQLNAGLDRKLILLSAPAGFGKTTLISEWVGFFSKGRKKDSRKENRIAWLSLDEADNDRARFLSYLISALNQVEGLETDFGKGIAGLLQSPQPPPTGTILTPLLNEITALPFRVIFVLDDYHLITAQPVHDALAFILQNLPTNMHLVLVTREDPPLPLARLRAKDQLCELRAADLRFSSAEANEFLNKVMGLDLSEEELSSLETRTEGWITGLQLAAISMQGRTDSAGFIKSFTGSHHFVLDYLIEEVLQRQSESVQTFLLSTSILERLCGDLCDAVTGQENSRQTLEYLDHANMFIIPLDHERRWYRYHHLFADLLRQRLHERLAASTGDAESNINELHTRASAWYEENGMEIEAFQHAAAANDIERAARLMEGQGMPLQYRGAMTPVLNWLASLPAPVRDARPSLWVMYASALTMVSAPISKVEQVLQAAESALAGPLQKAEVDASTRDLVGHIAAIRAMLAVPWHQAETIITQSLRALEYLDPGNLPLRTTTSWTLGFAYQLQGERAAAIRAYTDAISISQASGNFMITLAASTSLGQVQETENQLYLAAESYRRVLQIAGDPPWPAACEAYLGLGRVCYEWNDLDTAEQHGQQCLQLLPQMENVDTPATCDVFLARLKLARGDTAEAATILARAEQFLRQHAFEHRTPEVAAARVLVLLRQGDLAAAALLAQKHNLPVSQARVLLARGDPSAAMAVLEPVRQQVEAKGWVDERLKVMVLQSVVLYAHGEKDQAVKLLGDALALAEPGGFIRLFVDEGLPMARMLAKTLTQGVKPDYIRRLLEAFPAAESGGKPFSNSRSTASGLVEPLSERELEVLSLIAEGLTNQEIANRLYLSLFTVKVHARNIYSKLGVKNRTQAVATAKALGILSQP